MKYSVIAVLFVSFIAGCGQNAPTTQNPQPVPTATVVTVKASPVAAASPVSKTATPKVKNTYPPESIANYLDVCGKSGNTKAYCDCSINKAQDLYTLNEFSEAYALAASGQKSDKMDKVLSACIVKQTKIVVAQNKSTISKPSSNKNSPVTAKQILDEIKRKYNYSRFIDTWGNGTQGLFLPDEAWNNLSPSQKQVLIDLARTQNLRGIVVGRLLGVDNIALDRTVWGE